MRAIGLALLLLLASLMLPASSLIPRTGSKDASAWSYHVRAGVSITSLAYMSTRQRLFASTSTPSSFSDALSQGSILGIDAVTGKSAWNLETGTWTAASLWSAGTVLVADMATASPGATHSVWAFSSSTGNELWSSVLSATGAIAGAAGPNVVLEDEQGLSEVAGRTGRSIWQYTPPPGCTISSAAADAAIIGVLLRCAPSSLVLDTVDVTTGKLRSRRGVAENYDSDGPPISVRVQDGLVAVSGLEQFSVFSGDGFLLAMRQTDDSGASRISGTKSDLLLLFNNPSHMLVADTIRLADGTTVKHLTEPFALSAGAVDGGFGYLTVAFPDPVLPAGLTMIDAEHGPRSLSALAFTPSVYSPVVAGGGRVYVASGSNSAHTSIEAFGLHSGGSDTSVEGAAKRPWPRACSLLQQRDLQGLTRQDYFPRETKVASPADPPGSECDYASVQPGGPYIALKVLWMASSDAAAARILSFEPTYLTSVPGFGDEGLQIQGGSDDASTVQFRQGPAILEVTVHNGAGLLMPIVRAIQAGLQRYWAART